MILSCCQSRTRPLKRSTASWKPVKNAPRWRLSSILQPASFDTLMPRTLATASVGRLLHHAHLARPARPSPDAAIIDHQSDRRRRQRTTASHALPTPRYAFVAQETCCGMVAISTHRSPPEPVHTFILQHHYDPSARITPPILEEPMGPALSDRAFSNEEGMHPTRMERPLTHQIHQDRTHISCL